MLAVCLGSLKVELEEVQCLLNDGALTVLIKMITSNPSHSVFQEAREAGRGAAEGRKQGSTGELDG